MAREGEAARWGCLVIGMVVGCLGVIGGFVLLCGGALGLGVLGVSQAEPLVLAVEQVKADPEVAERLGEPMMEGWPTRMEISSASGQGKAILEVPIRGPLAGGVLHAKATRLGSSWVFDRLGVVYDGGGDEWLIGEAPPALGGGGEADDTDE